MPLLQAALSVLALTLLSGPGAGFVTRYDITDLGTFGGFTSVALGINSKGQVVGSADTSTGSRRAFLWENGAMQNLGTIPGQAQSEAWDINEDMQVVGIASDSGDIQDAFIWQNGQMTELGDPAQAKNAFAINDAGQIVGAAIFPPPISGQHAMLLENGVLTDLTAAGFCSGIAWDINSQGHVAGGGCIWKDGTNIDLGTLGGLRTGAQSINDLGQVAGSSERAGVEFVFHAFLWENGEMSDIGLLVEPLGGMLNSDAEAINNKGQIVGAGTVQFGVAAGAFSEGFLFDPIHGPMLLKDTLPPNSGWSQLSPRDINDNGWIVGSGTAPGGLPNRAFLMTPLPPIPATSSTMLVVLVITIVIAAYVVIAKRAPQ